MRRLALAALLLSGACAETEATCGAGHPSTVHDGPAVACVLPDGDDGLCASATTADPPACFPRCGELYGCAPGTIAYTVFTTTDGVTCWCQPGTPPVPPFAEGL